MNVVLNNVDYRGCSSRITLGRDMMFNGTGGMIKMLTLGLEVKVPAEIIDANIPKPPKEEEKQTDALFAAERGGDKTTFVTLYFDFEELTGLELLLNQGIPELIDQHKLERAEDAVVTQITQQENELKHSDHAYQ